MAFYDNAIRIFRKFFLRVYRINVIGAENIPADGTPTLICCNHTHAMDPVVLCAATGVKIYYMAKEELFRIPLLGSLCRAFGAVPVKRGTGDIGALKKIIGTLTEQKAVGIFPQGHRNPGVSPRGTVIHPGTGMILRRTGVAALPVCIRTAGHRLMLFKKTDVIIGAPVTQEVLSSALPAKENRQEDYRAVTEYIFDRICQMDETGKNEL